MGRKPLPPDMRRIRLSLTLPKKLIEEIKTKDVNISKLVEDFLQNYLKNEKK